ncbi:MAG: 1-acyl-sn-glycerol-3-phosphate acyltransferase [Bacteroidetes bacterium]|nr:1-acyl-sn-glycerol-3-phosphate acyltransferase [Bacteroidota bacterium]MBU1578027.1 1-acyl-sn-glycerol-3-phosphate acyltransferase [Bacteroidota bacterium]MBU2465060.1 1-acyl-sn-glycerol-3-phosphate acyltransferase [Bacteroidota bacterium]MBU2556331.1 1-acyl-sn-glycerol-3-phosphate acyltransferase [Bacteroidota bacterium]
MKSLSRLILRLTGWKINGEMPSHIQKCVILAAPHTSNWDFFYGRLAYFILGVPVKFLIKKESFQNPLGGLLKKLGGIPVDRGRHTNLVENIARLFHTQKQLNVVITPEGTRKLVKEWKKGFYYIALKANVPIVLGFLDYDKKEAGFGLVIYPSGDFQKDLTAIETFYQDKTARYPENFNLSPQNRLLRKQRAS